MKRSEFLKQLGLGLYKLPQHAAGKIMLKYTGLTENLDENGIDELGSPTDIAAAETEAFLYAHPHSESRGTRLTTLGCLIPACVTIATVLFSILVLFLIIDPLSKRVHIGNRVKGEIIVTLDGAPVDIESLVIEGDGSGRQRMKFTANKVSYSFRGNEYEWYQLTCGLEGELPRVELNYAHLNWWEESRAITHIDIVTADDGAYSCAYRIEYRYLDDDNRWKTSETSGECEAVKGLLVIGYGM